MTVEHFGTKNVHIQHSLFPVMFSAIIYELIGFAIIIGGIFASRYLNIPLIVVFSLVIVFFINLWIFSQFYTWNHSYYKISKDSISYNKKQIMMSNVDVFTINENSNFELSQGLIGRLFNFGTIEVLDPTFKGKIMICNIKNPRKVMKSFIHLVTSTRTSDILISKR